MTGLFQLILVLLLAQAVVAVPQYTDDQVHQRFFWVLQRLEVAFRLVCASDIRFIFTLLPPGATNAFDCGGQIRFTMHQLKRALFVAQNIFNLFLNGKTKKKRTIIYRVARLFDVIEKTAGAYVHKALCT